jgi:hypothetical protein
MNKGHEMISNNAGASGQFKIGDIAINRLGYGPDAMHGAGVARHQGQSSDQRRQ